MAVGGGNLNEMHLNKENYVEWREIGIRVLKYLGNILDEKIADDTV